jgi:hypothetical protein
MVLDVPQTTFTVSLKAPFESSTAGIPFERIQRTKKGEGTRMLVQAGSRRIRRVRGVRYEGVSRNALGLDCRGWEVKISCDQALCSRSLESFQPSVTSRPRWGKPVGLSLAAGLSERFLFSTAMNRDRLHTWLDRISFSRCNPLFSSCNRSTSCPCEWECRTSHTLLPETCSIACWQAKHSFCSG